MAAAVTSSSAALRLLRGGVIHSLPPCHLFYIMYGNLHGGPEFGSKDAPRLLWSSSEESSGTIHGFMHRVDRVCNILEGTGSWSSTTESALVSVADLTSQPEELVVAVLKKLKNFDLALKYFRWTEKNANQVHCPESYNCLLRIMVRNKKFDSLCETLEEMSVAGFGPSVSTCIEFIESCVRSRKLKEALHFIETMRKFKFRPAFSAYTTLIGALSYVNEADIMLNLVHQMQELGYEVHVPIFTTLIRAFAREGRIDDALSLLDEMKSNSFRADIVLYNVCIDSFWKARQGGYGLEILS